MEDRLQGRIPFLAEYVELLVKRNEGQGRRESTNAIKRSDIVIAKVIRDRGPQGTGSRKEQA